MEVTMDKEMWIPLEEHEFLLRNAEDKADALQDLAVAEALWRGYVRGREEIEYGEAGDSLDREIYRLKQPALKELKRLRDEK